jgi:serine/threonine protein kinase
MLALGELVGGRYRVGSLLGRGGMADVYRGVDLASGDPVAIKLLRCGPAQWSPREVQALSRLDHPAIVRMRASGLDGATPYVILDLVDGEPLSTVLSRGVLPVGVAVGIVARVADGLAHAHACGVVHRDVKPSNILLDSSGRPHLADFGIARLVDSTATTGAGFVVGTASYLAPEQVRAERVGPAADVYALGLVLLECLTGRRAFPGTFIEAAAAHLAHDPTVPAKVSPALARLIKSATSRDPGARPSARELALALRPTAAPERGPHRPPRRSLGTPIAAIVLGSAVGVAGGLALAPRNSPGSPPATTVVTAPPTTVAPTTVPATTTPTTAARAVPTTAPPPAVSAPASKGKRGKGHNKQSDD